MSRQTIDQAGVLTAETKTKLNENFAELYAGGSGEVLTDAVLVTSTATTSFLPTVSDATTLGSTTKQFSDLFLAEGGVINWDNGDATITQTSNVVVLAGASLETSTVGTAANSVVTIDGTQTLTNKTMTAPALGTPASLVGTNITGTAAGLTAGVASAVAVGSITGAGTGVLAALAIANGASGGYAVNAVGGVAAAYKLARVTMALDGSNPTSWATGLTTIVAAGATLNGTAAPGVGTSVLTSNINGTSLDVYAWKVTATGDCTLIASTGTESFSAWAVGT